MDRAAAGVRRQLQLAREEKDVVKSLCLNDKLNQIDLATRTATDRVSGLEAGVAANDAERVEASVHRHSRAAGPRDDARQRGQSVHRRGRGFRRRVERYDGDRQDIPEVDPTASRTIPSSASRLSSVRRTS